MCRSVRRHRKNVHELFVSEAVKFTNAQVICDHVMIWKGMKLSERERPEWFIRPSCVCVKMTRHGTENHPEALHHPRCSISFHSQIHSRALQVTRSSWRRALHHPSSLDPAQREVKGQSHCKNVLFSSSLGSLVWFWSSLAMADMNSSGVTLDLNCSLCFQ